MKKRYVEPIIKSERFQANEYISSCTDTKNKYYKFVCDAGGGDLADIYEGKYPNGTNLTAGSYICFHACNIEHYVLESEANFAAGWYDADYTDGGNSDNGIDYKFDVMIWKGEDNDNVHATKSLQEDIKIVEGNKS